MIKMKHFSQNFPLMSIGPTHGQNEHKQHIANKLHARSHIIITKPSQTPTGYLISCQSHRAMCPLLDMRLLIGEHHATVYIQDKKIKSIYDMEAKFSSIGISHTIFMIYKFKHGT
jgi:hypothetical protein